MSRSRSRSVVAAAVAGLIGVALLGTVAVRGAQDRTVAAATEAPAAQVTGSGAQVGAQAPKVRATSLDGQAVQLPGEKPSVAFFFASWCASCIAEAAALGELHRAHGDDVDIVAVSIDPGDTPEAIGEFMQAAGSPGYRIVLDATDSIRAAYDVTALDVTVVTDAQGVVVYRDSVPSTLDQLQEGLRRAGVKV